MYSDQTLMFTAGKPTEKRLNSDNYISTSLKLRCFQLEKKLTFYSRLGFAFLRYFCD